MKCLHDELNPSEELDRLSRMAAQRIAVSVEQLREQGLRKIELWTWIKREIIVSVTDSIYGPTNPFKDSEVVNAFLSLCLGLRAA